jgi:hypothetical protein
MDQFFRFLSYLKTVQVHGPLLIVGLKLFILVIKSQIHLVMQFF